MSLQRSPATTFHSDIVAGLVRGGYSAESLPRLRKLLLDSGALHFRTIGNGLYPAAHSASRETSGYCNVWVRDNVFVALAHFRNGALAPAVAVVRSLAKFFNKHRSRFTNVISGAVDPRDLGLRVNVRFDGVRLEEISQNWAHAQNDALGYFLWLFCKMARAQAIALDERDLDLLGLFVAYFQAIRFWEDEDYGHWEERAKICASSIGVVVGGIRQLVALLEADRAARAVVGAGAADKLIEDAGALLAKGMVALQEILPAECIQTDPKKRRMTDAALLFLIYPVEVTDAATADAIIGNVIKNLMGEYGIRRYRGDSYWCGNYKALLPPGDRSRDFSNDIESRDALLREGEEAQWCIFDPILSIIYGKRFIASRARADLERQIFHFDRSLGQVDSRLRCPEAYYLENGIYVPNDNTPLFWTQANLWLALRQMDVSVSA